MYLCLLHVSSLMPFYAQIGLLTIVPNVINPTRALGGSNDKLMTKDSFSVFKLSSSWQVSTTYTKIGGAEAGRASWYSIVVLAG